MSSATSTNKFDALKISDEEEDAESDTLLTSSTDLQNAPLSVPAHHHRLSHTYCLWFSSVGGGSVGGPATFRSASFDRQLQLVGRFGSIEQFWPIYSHCSRVDTLRGHCDFHLFRDGIRPMWEDETNRRGGKWLVRLRKGLAARMWENLVLATLGGQFSSCGDTVCGVVVSLRHSEDVLSLWNSRADDVTVTGKLRDVLRSVLNLPSQTIMEYRTHMDSMRDKSSYRSGGTAASGGGGGDLFVK